MIQLVSNHFLGGITGFFPPNSAGDLPAPVSVSPRYYLIPVSTALGGLIAGLLIFEFAPEAEGHGTDEAIDAFHRKKGIIRKRVPIVKMIASAFTIGSGGSAGREGPTAQIAAGFGSIIGGLLKLSPRDRRIAVAVGIGAGIGTIFKSPFGGAILSAEILYSGGDMEFEALIPSFVATPIGYSILASLTGFTPIFGYTVYYSFNNPVTLVFFAVLGGLCGGFGRLYTYTYYGVKSWFDRLKLPKFTKPMIGGAIAGVIGIFFPEVTGLGYGFLQYVLDGDLNKVTLNYIAIPLVIAFVVIVFLKIFATSVTIASGGSGGVFAPALVIGGFIGAFLWALVNYLFPGLISSPAPLVICGMMALYGGVGRAPIAVIIMVSEMTGTLALLAPSMLSVVIAYYLTGEKFSIYRSQVRTRIDSPAHTGEYSMPLLSRMYVRDIMTKDVPSLSPEQTVEESYAFMKEKQFRAMPVTMEKKIIGFVSLEDLLLVPDASMRSVKVRHVLRSDVLPCYPDETLLDALKKMTKIGSTHLPVVSRESEEVEGMISRTDLFEAYSKAASSFRDQPSS